MLEALRTRVSELQTVAPNVLDRIRTPRLRTSTRQSTLLIRQSTRAAGSGVLRQPSNDPPDSREKYEYKVNIEVRRSELWLSDDAYSWFLPTKDGKDDFVVDSNLIKKIVVRGIFCVVPLH